MKISEYMAKVTAAEATGEYVGRDMVLGLDCGEAASTAGKAGDFTYVGTHVEDYGAKLDAKTEDKSYVYEGDSTVKTSTQRTFQITGQDYISDDFMDFIRSHAVKFGKGSAVQREQRRQRCGVLHRRYRRGAQKLRACGGVHLYHLRRFLI